MHSYAHKTLSRKGWMGLVQARISLGNKEREAGSRLPLSGLSG